MFKKDNKNFGRLDFRSSQLSEPAKWAVEFSFTVVY